MASKKRSEPNENQTGLFAPPSMPALQPKYVPLNPETIIGVAAEAIDLDTFDDYHDSHERNESSDPSPIVACVPVDGSFEVSLRRHDGYAIHCFIWTRAELEELQTRITGALKS